MVNLVAIYYGCHGEFGCHDAYHVHVDAIGDTPGVLKVVLDALPQGIGDLVKADEFLNTHYMRVVAGRARVEALDDGRDVAENRGVHER